MFLHLISYFGINAKIKMSLMIIMAIMFLTLACFRISEHLARQQIKYLLFYQSLHQKNTLCIRLSNIIALSHHLSDWQKQFAAYPDFLASLPFFPESPPDLLLLCCIKKEVHHQTALPHSKTLFFFCINVSYILFSIFGILSLNLK